MTDDIEAVRWRLEADLDGYEDVCVLLADHAKQTAEAQRLRLLLTDLKVASAIVEAEWDGLGSVNGENYAHWNHTINAASGYLAKDNPDPSNEAALTQSTKETGT